VGSRRRRVVKIIKRRLPTVFDCPECGENSIKVTINKKLGKSLIQCGVCGLREELETKKSAEPIDVYCLFTDNFNQKTATV
jgi:transcription elongation factor Elf1